VAAFNLANVELVQRRLQYEDRLGLGAQHVGVRVHELTAPLIAHTLKRGSAKRLRCFSCHAAINQREKARGHTTVLVYQQLFHATTDAA
jgi:hypothetical protein